MIVEIKKNAVQFNCHWYCTKVGMKFKVTFNPKNNCYELFNKRVKHLIYKDHAEVKSKDEKCNGKIRRTNRQGQAGKTRNSWSEKSKQKNS